jgi:hypothetical protein
MSAMRDCIKGSMICDGPDDSDDTNRTGRFGHDDGYRCATCREAWKAERKQPASEATA